MFYDIPFQEVLFYLISLAAVVCCAFAFVLRGAHSKYVDDSSSVILQLFSMALGSNSLLYVTIAIMGSAVPMIIFLFCDLLLCTIYAAYIRFYRLATILFPCSLIIFIAIPSNNVVVLAFAVTTQTIFHLCGFIVRIHSYGIPVRSFRINITILILWTTALCLQINQLVISRNIYFELGELICFIIGFIIFSYSSWKWIIHVAKQYRKNKNLSLEEFTCTKNVVILYVALIIRFVVIILCKHRNVPGSIVVILATQNIAALLVVVLHEYVLRSRVTQMEV